MFGNTHGSNKARRILRNALLLVTLAAGAARPLAAQNAGGPGVYDWGSNVSGQLGDLTYVQRNTPVHVQSAAIPGAITPLIAIAVAGGEQHSMALDGKGRVYTWGDNTYGQLGQGAFGGNSTKALSIAKLPSDIIAIAAGGYHCFALEKTGRLWAWGRNDFGQIGNNAPGTHIASPVPVLNLKENQDLLLNVVAIAAGEQHSLAVLRDGTVRAWGENNYGQLGSTGGFDNAAHPLPEKVLGLGSVKPILNGVIIAAGGYHSLAIQTLSASVGTLVYSWGANTSGQLGDGTFANNPTPKPVIDSAGNKLTGAIAIAGGLGGLALDVTGKPLGANAHSLALMRDGTMRGWGHDKYGQIGDGVFLAAAPSGNPFPQKVLDTAALTVFQPARVIAAGGFHSIACKKDATSWAWGLDSVGQLGDNSPGVNENLPTHIHAPYGGPGFLDGVFTVGGGGRHSLAIVGAHVTGKIILVGVTNAAQTVTFLFTPVNGSDPFTRTVELSTIATAPDTGLFDMSDIPQQPYLVHIKGAKWLAQNLALDTTAGDVSGISASLLGGDANDDNTVDIADFGILVNAYGTVTGDKNYDPAADFTCDGSVDIADFGILVNSYGQTGAP